MSTFPNRTTPPQKGGKFSFTYANGIFKFSGEVSDGIALALLWKCVALLLLGTGTLSVAPAVLQAHFDYVPPEQSHQQISNQAIDR